MIAETALALSAATCVLAGVACWRTRAPRRVPAAPAPRSTGRPREALRSGANTTPTEAELEARALVARGREEQDRVAKAAVYDQIRAERRGGAPAPFPSRTDLLPRPGSLRAAGRK